MMRHQTNVVASGFTTMCLIFSGALICLFLIWDTLIFKLFWITNTPIYFKNNQTWILVANKPLLLKHHQTKRIINFGSNTFVSLCCIQIFMYVQHGLHGSGRGSRALLKWLKNDSTLSILSIVKSPFPSPDAENVISCGFYATSMLHHAETPSSHTISPVIYMWRPNQKSTNGSEDHVKVNNGQTFRQLW
ncbi:ribonucleases P/MRP protein subunit POP1 [Lactuca sativa]|uniref:ribonucleases P/MRP protein subunit POP1 n=1 Tax=Lactuca sativa TaxID=4236 RepID=UPI001C68B6DD|nr:ribonucleases P/MRP protein subunit POP1 [Lactuca sativa]XP_052622201.1 ribonucleases P/MRP protein subunit POP1 [Lactuca sativa]